MKRFFFFLAASLCVCANAQVKEDFVPSPNNQPGKQYPTSLPRTTSPASSIRWSIPSAASACAWKRPTPSP